MTVELTTIVGQLNIREGKWRNKAPNQVAVREPKSADTPGMGKGDLFIVTEIQGTTDKIDVLEERLAQAVRDSYYLSRGSVTASLRRAVQTGNSLLFHHNQQAGPEARLVGGVVVLAMCQEDTFVAQFGPTAFYAVLGDHIQRYPLRSVWLDEAISPAQDEYGPALGLNKLVEPNLHHLRVSPKDMLILADSRLASQLPLKDLVQAMMTGNIKTAMKKLGKVAKAYNCSALAMEVVEATPATIGPLKIATPPQLSSFLSRRRSHSEPAEMSESQDRDAPATIETANEQFTSDYADDVSAHSSDVVTSRSVFEKPLRWLGTFGRKSEPEVPDMEEPVYNNDDITEASYHQQLYEDYETEPEEVLERGRTMTSMAPETTFGSRSHHNKAADNLPSVGKIFRWVGVGLLMVIALLGSGLKTILGLVLPSGSSHGPRLAGTHVQRQPPTASTWKMLRNIALAIPLLIALVVSISYLQKGRIREAEYNEFLTTAQNKFEQAQAVPDVSSALGLMAEAETALVQAEKIKETQPEITALRHQMAEDADRRGNVIRLDNLPQLRQYTDPGTYLKSIIVQGVEIYIIDTGNDRIYHHRLDDSGEALLPDEDSVIMLSRGQTVENVTVNDLLGATWMPTGGNRQTSDLVILNSTGLLEYNPNWGLTTSALAGGESLVLPNAVDSFFGNFYILDSQANALLRYRPTNDGYSDPPESYFAEGQPVDLTNAIDLTIDGAVYILYQDGRINKYLSGQPDNFNVTGLDIPFNNPVAIFTAPEEEVQHVYVADAGNRRIVKLNKDGSFVRQFKPQQGQAVSFANLQDIFVDEIGAHMYILDSNNFYLANIPTDTSSSTE